MIDVRVGVDVDVGVEAEVESEMGNIHLPSVGAIVGLLQVTCYQVCSNMEEEYFCLVL